MKRIGVLTSGGDAPGMNATIRSVVRSGLAKDLEVMGIFRGFGGLINDEIKPFNHRSVSNIINRGGTILKTSRCEEFLSKEGQQKAVEVIKKNNIDGLVIIGGDGSYRGALALSKDWGIKCIGVPGTIDNDLTGTEYTIGSDTALNTALEAIDKIRDTATSLERIFVVEVMGRLSGYIALNVALAAGAEQVIIPERKFDLHEMCHEITEGYIRGKASWIVIVAEGVIKGQDIAEKITQNTDLETRVVVLGHVQRGGSPTAKDRVLATCLGAAAVDLLVKGESGKAVGIVGEDINVVTLEKAVTKKVIKTETIYNLIKILT
ncbi:MAG: 6-phosphofructokinase [Candidatus Omnitrophica bacterium]|nr:6-phosphofructokinase [Candidatus Omnitrophota bacterium]MDD5351812.1 6-phosphofructokinase [Candidatus Omnitrophota bacterium]MDD5550638.1 6-phosphofructokinase [Candidatus Omnitrophota bacterium]